MPGMARNEDNSPKRFRFIDERYRDAPAEEIEAAQQRFRDYLAIVRRIHRTKYPGENTDDTWEN